MLVGKIVQRDATVRKNGADAKSAFLAALAGHYLRPKRYLHFGPGPDDGLGFHNLIIGIRFAAGYFLFMFCLSLRRVNAFFGPVAAEFLRARRRRFPDRIENRAVVLFWPLTLHSVL